MSSGVPEGARQGVPIQAQSTAVAVATARICNAERRGLASPGGHVGWHLTLSHQSTFAPEIFTTLAHLVVSLAISAANSAELPPPATAP
jgi:hypothetical protein